MVYDCVAVMSCRDKLAIDLPKEVRNIFSSYSIMSCHVTICVAVSLCVRVCMSFVLHYSY